MFPGEQPAVRGVVGVGGRGIALPIKPGQAGPARTPSGAQEAALMFPGEHSAPWPGTAGSLRVAPAVAPSGGRVLEHGDAAGARRTIAGMSPGGRSRASSGAPPSSQECSPGNINPLARARMR